jgi:O-antigen/teichoic acid export membrane protein
VPSGGTYALLLVVASGTLVTVNARELIRLLAPTSYAGAADVVPWVVAGAVLQGVYLIWATGTWYSKKTAALPVVTVVSALVNIGLNLLFVPRYGVMAAAVTTTIGYLVAALLHGALAQHLHPIPWEYGRWAALFGAAGACLVATRYVHVGNTFVALALKTGISAMVFPAVLAAVGFVRAGEVVRGAATLGRRLGRRS